MAEHTTDRIFVAIPCYRDPELLPTLRSLWAGAAAPARVSVGICLQMTPGLDDATFRGLSGFPRTRVACFDARTARGLGWARSEAHALREDEPFVLQIDSHMRFHSGWDTDLLAMLTRCPSDRPVLSCYPSGYKPWDPPDRPLECTRHVLSGLTYLPNGMSMFRAREFAGDDPVPSPFLAGGFAFSTAQLYDEVPYDPAIGFGGEELGYSLRAYTHGWDFFAPPRCVIHHYYERTDAPNYHDDHPDWYVHEALSMLRLHHLLGSAVPMAPSVIADLDGRLGLGTRRTRAEFERLAGLDLSALTTLEAEQPARRVGAHGPERNANV